MKRLIGILLILILFSIGCKFKECDSFLKIESIKINDEFVARHEVRRIYFELLLTNEYEDTLKIDLDEFIYYYDVNEKIYLKASHFKKTDFSIPPSSNEYVTFVLDHNNNGTVYELFLKLRKTVFYIEENGIEYKICYESNKSRLNIE